MSKRLPSLIDDPSQPAYVRELLQAGRDFHAADYDVGKGLDKHLAHIAAGTPAPQWAQSLQAAQGLGAAGAASGSLVPWIVLPLATASVIAAVMLSTSPEPATPPAVVAAPQPAAAPITPAEPAVDNGSARPPAAERSAAPVSTQQPAPAVPRPERAAQRTKRSHGSSTAKSAAAAVARDTAAPSLPLKTATREAAVQPAGTTQAAGDEPASPAAAEASIAIEDPQPAASAQPAPPPAQPEPAPQDDARLEREMAMLAMSQRVLHTDPARALKLAQQGEAEFPASMFTQERRQLLLLALVKLDRLEEAKRLAKPYLARYPNGPFSDRVRRALATGRVER